jgi:predicted Zn-dependent peptidase
MIKFESHTLKNGLKVIVHQDKNTHIAAMNIAYNVGSRDEQPNHTGFAHLFEHLMFGGSKNVPSYDEPLQKVGGENNAYTTPDLTNYYLTVPASNIETGFWLESDRMLSLSFEEKVLEVQRKVVIEEFHQRYLNQPYGDVWHKLRDLAYRVHPYQWPTIGARLSHIEEATMEQVKSFFKKFYSPNNAVMVLAGNIHPDKAFKLSEAWFEEIPAQPDYLRELPKEPQQDEQRRLVVNSDVPVDALYKVYHMPGKTDSDYHAADLLSDILGRGRSSRLHTELVEDKKMFSSISSYVLGSMDPGLLVVSGKLSEGVNFESAELAIDNLTKKIQDNLVGDKEIEKVKNQALSSIAFSEVEVLNRAMNLAYFSLIGDADLANTESAKIKSVRKDDIRTMAGKILTGQNSSVMYYQAK